MPLHTWQRFSVTTISSMNQTEMVTQSYMSQSPRATVKYVDHNLVSLSLSLVAFLCLYNEASVALQYIYTLIATWFSDELLIFFSSLVLGCI